MKRFCFFIILSVIYANVFAGAIQGRIVDKFSRVPLEFAQLSLLQLSDKKLVTGTTTGLNGVFELKGVADGRYLLKCSFVGYQLVELPVVIDAKHADIKLGSIEMEETTTSLNELKVTGIKSQMKFELDKKVFNVDQNLAGSGSSATELLRNIPSVEVAADGNILLRNNKNVIIWINGRPAGLNEENRTQILEQLPAETIEKVEIISNPSAKYNPEGSAGVINIVLKKSAKTGTYGSVTAGIDTNPSKNLSANIFVVSPKWEFNVNAGYRNDVKNMFFNSDRKSWTPGSADTTFRYSRDEVVIDGGGFFARGSVLYHASKYDVIGLSLMGTTANRRVTEDINNRRIKTGIATLDYRYTDAAVVRNLFDGALDYTRTFEKPGHEIKAFAGINYNKADGDNEVIQKDSVKTPQYYQWSTSLSTRTETTLQLDYAYPLTDSVRLEAGFKGEYLKRSTNTLAEIGPDTEHRLPQYELNNLFDGVDNRNSVYINFSGKLKRINWQAGLRAEYNQQKNNSTTYNALGKDTLTVFDYNYPGLYPSVFIDYHLPADNQLQFNYTRRINRPKGRMINPFINMADSSNIEFGNPDLKPEFTNAIELSHIKTWDEHMLSTVLYYRTTENVIQWVNYVISNGNYDTKYITPENITNSKSAGIELMSKNRLFKMMDLTSTVNLFYNQLDGFEYGGTHYDATSNLAWSGRVIANLALPADIAVQVSGGYQSRRKIAQGETLPIWGIDAGIRKSFFDKRLTVNISARDIAKTRVSKDIARGYNFYDYSFYQFNASSIGVVLTYNFGKQTKKSNNKTNGNEPNPLGGDF